MHVELGPTLLMTYVYEIGGSSTPFEDIYFAANEDLSDRVEAQVTSHDSSTHLPLILLPVSLDVHSSCGSSITSTEAGSDRYTWVRRNTYQEDTTFSSSLSTVPSPPPSIRECEAKFQFNFYYNKIYSLQHSFIWEHF